MKNLMTLSFLFKLKFNKQKSLSKLFKAISYLKQFSSNACVGKDFFVDSSSACTSCKLTPFAFSKMQTECLSQEGESLCLLFSVIKKCHLQGSCKTVLQASHKTSTSKHRVPASPQTHSHEIYPTDSLHIFQRDWQGNKNMEPTSPAEPCSFSLISSFFCFHVRDLECQKHSL